MNANQLWAGNDYAWTEYRGRGVTYVENAKRVRVMRIKQERDFGSERARTMVEVHMCDNEGNPLTYSSGEPYYRTVRARDIFMRWEEYEDEREYRHRERDRIRQAQEEREAKELAIRTQFIDAFCDKTGIDRNMITSVDASIIRINRGMAERWMGIDQDQ